MVSKKKSSNPLDAHRKAARSRELQKNKEQREKAREISLVKRDTHTIEKQIQQLQSNKSRSTDEDAELVKLLSEVKKIKQAKDEYLSKHPEHRPFVYPKEAALDDKHVKASEDSAAVLQKQVPLRDPRRSVYYDATFNPFGAPPPGMPYREKTSEQWEEEQRRLFPASLDSDESDSRSGGESDDGDDESDDNDEDIVMPEGPPPMPLAARQNASIETAEDAEDTSEDEDGIVMPQGPPPAPPSAPKAMLQASIASPRPRPPVSNWQPPLPPTPPTKALHSAHTSVHPPTDQINSAVNALGTRPMQSARPPLMPTQARPASHPPSAASSTVITSAPVLRDLKKEATAFVPTALRRKQASQK